MLIKFSVFLDNKTLLPLQRIQDNYSIEYFNYKEGLKYSKCIFIYRRHSESV